MGTVATQDISGTDPNAESDVEPREEIEASTGASPQPESGSAAESEPDSAAEDRTGSAARAESASAAGPERAGAAGRRSRSDLATGDDRDRQPRSIQLRLSTVLTAVAGVVLLAVAAVFAWLYFSAESTLSDRDSQAADDRHAEQVASDYALGASTIDFHDVKSWLDRLKANTTPQLSAKFDATGSQLEQILVPLQWTSKATPLSSTVTSESGGIYKVNAYLDVTSTSAQTPDGGRTTVTYSVTIDRNSGWKITDVGGLQNALPVK